MNSLKRVCGSLTVDCTIVIIKYIRIRTRNITVYGPTQIILFHALLPELVVLAQFTV